VVAGDAAIRMEMKPLVSAVLPMRAFFCCISFLDYAQNLRLHGNASHLVSLKTVEPQI